MRSENLRGAALMVASMTGFVCNDAFIRVVLEEVPLFQTTFLRGCLLTLALWVIAVASGAGRLHIAAPNRPKVWLRSGAEFCGALLFLSALTLMEFATLSAVMQFLPLSVTLAAALSLGEPVGWRRLLAIAIGFLGVLLIIQPGTDAFDPASILVLACVACVTVREIATRSLSRETPSLTVATWTSVILTLGFGIGSLFIAWAPIRLDQLIWILCSTAFLVIGFIASVAAMRTGEVGFVAPFRYSSLIVALILGYAAFGEVPNPLALIGAAIVVGMGLFTLWREQVRRAEAPHQPGVPR